MNRSKKTFLWVTGGTSVFIVLFAFFFLLARHAVNLEFVKTEVVHIFSEKTDGQLAYEKADISFFPRTRIVFHSVNFSIPQKISGTVASLTLYPRLLSLLKGDVQLAGVKALAPDLIVTRPDPLAKKPGKESDPTEVTGPAIAKPGTLVPNIGVEVRQGRVVFSGKNGPIFSFHEINARMSSAKGKSTIHLDGQSNLWDSLSFDADLNRKNSQIKGQIAIHELHPHKITDHLFPRTPRKLSNSHVNLDMDIQGVWPDTFHGRITGDIPALTLQREKIQTAINARTLNGAFRIDKDILTVTLGNIELSQPHLSLSGKFQKNRNNSRISLDLEGRDIDVVTARKTALAAGGDIPVIGHIFDIVKSGHVPAINFSAHGNRFADLGRLENFTLTGHLVDGGIFIPGFKRSVDQVTGDVVIANGVLEGKKLTARLGNSKGADGNLKIGLSSKKAPFHLDIMIDADLVQLPPVLKQVVGHQQFLKELDRIKNFKGAATGKLVLGESLGAITAQVIADGFNLSGTYNRLPYPLEIKGGLFLYDKRGVTVKKLKGKIGNSEFSSLTGHIDFSAVPLIDVSKGNLTLALGEFYPWISTFDSLQISKNIQTATGNLALSQMHLKGPLLDPVAWDIDAAGSFQNLVLHSILCPMPLTVKDGHFHAMSHADEKTVSFSDTRLTFFDAALTGSGIINLDAGESNKGEALFKGHIGPASNRWLSTRLHLPSELALQSPLSISSASLSWGEPSGQHFIGDLKFPQGPNLHLDIIQTPDAFRLNDITIRDENSRASATLGIKNKTLDFNFQGRIDQTTSDKIFVDSNLPDGWIDGNLNAVIRLDKPMTSIVKGNLKGGGLKLLRILGVPFDIDTISLIAKQNRVRLASAVIACDKGYLDLKGDILFSKDGLRLDMDVASDRLNIDNIQSMLKKAGHTKYAGISAPANSGPVKDDPAFDYPVTGVFRLTSATLVYGQTIWQPFQAEVKLNRDDIKINVTHAEINGILTPGQVSIKKSTGDLTLEFKPEAKNQLFGPIAGWLSGGRANATGLFDLDGILKAQGPSEMMPASMTGDFELIARDGSIFKDTTLSSILTFLNSTEILFGKNPGIGKEGFAYKTIKLKATLENGRLILKEAVMDGASMELIGQGYIDLIEKKLNLTVLVAPLKTVDRVIKMTPLVGYILAGSLVSIPLAVTGDYAQPKISILPVAAVGRGVMGILERTLKLPLKIIEPMMPKKIVTPSKPEPN